MSDKGFRSVEENCVISEDVIATIAGTAVKEIPGVAGLGQKPSDIFGKIGSAGSRAVKIVNKDGEPVITIYIQVTEGAHIQEVAAAVQRAVKKEVQAMTGRPVTRVDVNIAGVVFAEA